jgi:hypothetical protein
VLELHLLRRLAQGALGACALVYTLSLLVALVEEPAQAVSGANRLVRAHEASWETLTSVSGLCVSIGAAIALSHFARERGGVAAALGGASFTRVVLPGALVLSAVIGIWRWAGPSEGHLRGAAQWSESDWGWIVEREDASLAWLWVEGGEHTLRVSRGPGESSLGPPAQAIAALGDAMAELPAWMREAAVLLFVLMALSVRLDRQPGGVLLEAVPIALLGHWGPVVLTPLVRAMTGASAAEADAITLCLLGAGLLIGARRPLV